MLVVYGKALFGIHPEPTRYYGVVCDTDDEAMTIRDDIVTTLPCATAGQAIANARLLVDDLIYQPQPQPDTLSTLMPIEEVAHAL